MINPQCAQGDAVYAGMNDFTYEDTDFVAGDSPITLDVLTDLGRAAHDGYITCDGAGALTVALSIDGTNYGGDHTVNNAETLNLEGRHIEAIKITHSGADSSYRVSVV